MCSNMGDTAATTFQLLYEVNEDVIIANVAWISFAMLSRKGFGLLIKSIE
jgi:hypothetical protein